MLKVFKTKEKKQIIGFFYLPTLICIILRKHSFTCNLNLFLDLLVKV